MLVFNTNIVLASEGFGGGTPPSAYTHQYAQVGFLLKEFLKTVGWTHVASGDGSSNYSTTPGNANDVITSALLIPGGMYHLAWFILQQPGSSRQISFQIENAQGSTWRILYSHSAGFINDVGIDPQTPPTADDERFIVGGGPYNAKTFEDWLGPSLLPGYGGAICHMAADDAAPYGFWIVGHIPVGGANNYGPPAFHGVMDPILNAASGDGDPYVFYFSKNLYQTLNNDMDGWPSPDQAAIHAYFNHGGANEYWAPITAARLTSATGTSGTGPFNFNNQIDLLSVYYSLNTSWSAGPSFPETDRPSGHKGRSTYLHWTGQSLPIGQTLQISAPRDTIVFGSMTFPWNGTLPRL